MYLQLHVCDRIIAAPVHPAQLEEATSVQKVTLLPNHRRQSPVISLTAPYYLTHFILCHCANMHLFVCFTFQLVNFHILLYMHAKDCCEIAVVLL